VGEHTRFVRSARPAPREHEAHAPTPRGGFRHRARYRPLGQARPRVVFRRSGLAREPEPRNTLQRSWSAAKVRASARRGLVPLGASADCGADFRFAVFFVVVLFPGDRFVPAFLAAAFFFAGVRLRAVFFCAAFFFARGLLLCFRPFFLPAISACPPDAQDRAFPAARKGVAPAPATVTLSGRKAAWR